MNNLLQLINFSETWIDDFRVAVVLPMRRDVSTHSAFDDEFISSDGPRIVSDIMCSGVSLYIGGSKIYNI